MGAINYYTSDYITLGFNVSEYDFETTKQEMSRLVKRPVEKLYNWEVNEWRNDAISFVREEMQNILDDYGFGYFHVMLVNGYYEGFSLTIDSNYPIAFDDSEDKSFAQKEITQVKACLKRLVDNGLSVVYPSWCTVYLTDRKECYKEIEQAIKAMREEVNNTPRGMITNVIYIEKGGL